MTLSCRVAAFSVIRDVVCLVHRFLIEPESPACTTPKCQADAEETDAAEAVEDFHAEVTDYVVHLFLDVLSFVLTLA